MRSYTVHTASTVQVVTTAEAKNHLKIDSSADDTLIDNLIKSATQLSEDYTNRFFTDTVITQYGTTFADIKELYKSTVSSITNIKYYDTLNSLRTLDSDVYYLNNSIQPAQISLSLNQSYPNLADRENAVECKYTVGYGSAASDVPEAIKQAILLTVGNWYNNRSSVVVGRISTELPLNVKWILDTYKVQVVR